MYQQEALFPDDEHFTSKQDNFKSKIIKVAGYELETTPVFEAYWYFATERQRMFKRRLKGSNAPRSSDDPILANHRFTNAYRASDRVSQYLIRNVIWNRPNAYTEEDIFLRTLVFKIFNRIDTWEAIMNQVGDLTAASFNFSDINAFLEDRKTRGKRNYSAAYIMASPSNFGFSSKHSNHLRLVEWMLDNDFVRKYTSSAKMGEAYELLISAPSIGPFLAYQFVTDLNYSALSNFSEMEFVVAGPGALDGISKCFVESKQVTPAEIIHHMAKHQEEYFEDYDQDFENLWGRPLQLIDCQNIFCEISKYSRLAFPEIKGLSGRTRIKQKFQVSGRLDAPWYPPDWGINDSIKAEFH